MPIGEARSVREKADPNGADRPRRTSELVVARDGEDALDYLGQRGDYDAREGASAKAVLLNQKSPKTEGVEVLQWLKTDPGLKAIPVVMLTSSREERALLRSYDLSANRTS